MNNINIFQEFLDMENRQNIKDPDVAAATGVSPAAVGKWMKKGNIDDKYLWKIASGLGDTRFQLAVFCYQSDLPSAVLNITKRYRPDDLSMVIGSQIEDMDSDEALEQLKVELSKPVPNKNVASCCVAEIIETGIQISMSAFKISKDLGIPIQTAFLERSYQNARN